MSHLIQIYLPLASNEGAAFPRSLYEEVERTLTERFDGFTAYSRSPADGLWSSPGKSPRREEIIVYEIIADELDQAWWKGYRETLEVNFQQESILIRAHQVRVL